MNLLHALLSTMNIPCEDAKTIKDTQFWNSPGTPPGKHSQVVLAEPNQAVGAGNPQVSICNIVLHGEEHVC